MFCFITYEIIQVMGYTYLFLLYFFWFYIQWIGSYGIQITWQSFCILQPHTSVWLWYHKMGHELQHILVLCGKPMCWCLPFLCNWCWFFIFHIVFCILHIWKMYIGCCRSFFQQLHFLGEYFASVRFVSQTCMLS